jgi:hypothetical protein
MLANYPLVASESMDVDVVPASAQTMPPFETRLVQERGGRHLVHLGDACLQSNFPGLGDLHPSLDNLAYMEGTRQRGTKHLIERLSGSFMELLDV